MRKTLSLTVLAALAIPLLAAVPATRVKEPNAVFAYDVDARTNRLVAVLFDRAKQRDLAVLDRRFEFPPYGIGGMNDTVQFSAATKKIYVGSVQLTEETKHLGYDGEFDTRIVEGAFDWKEPRQVFSCHDCHVTGWIAHPVKPKLYVAIKDEFTVDEFRNAKLLEITLEPTLRTRVIGRVPAGEGLAITPDGSHVFVFAQAENSNLPYGELVSIRLSDRRRVKTVVNLPREDVFGSRMRADTRSVSPDMREIVYPNSVLDIRAEKASEILKPGPFAEAHAALLWSRDSTQVLFSLRQEHAQGDDPGEAKIILDRDTKQPWTLPVMDVYPLDWAPAQTAILMRKDVDIGFYDLQKREWVHVLEGLTMDYSADASWVTLPTKRVPKR